VPPLSPPTASLTRAHPPLAEQVRHFLLGSIANAQSIALGLVICSSTAQVQMGRERFHLSETPEGSPLPSDLRRSCSGRRHRACNCTGPVWARREGAANGGSGQQERSQQPASTHAAEPRRRSREPLRCALVHLWALPRIDARHQSARGPRPARGAKWHSAAPPAGSASCFLARRTVSPLPHGEPPLRLLS